MPMSFPVTHLLNPWAPCPVAPLSVNPRMHDAHSTQNIRLLSLNPNFLLMPYPLLQLVSAPTVL
jgi:hypothetical protein